MNLVGLASSPTGPTSNLTGKTISVEIPHLVSPEPVTQSTFNISKNANRIGLNLGQTTQSAIVNQMRGLGLFAQAYRINSRKGGLRTIPSFGPARIHKSTSPPSNVLLFWTPNTYPTLSRDNFYTIHSYALSAHFHFTKNWGCRRWVVGHVGSSDKKDQSLIYGASITSRLAYAVAAVGALNIPMTAHTQHMA